MFVARLDRWMSAICYNIAYDLICHLDLWALALVQELSQEIDVRLMIKKRDLMNYGVHNLILEVL